MWLCPAGAFSLGRPGSCVETIPSFLTLIVAPSKPESSGIAFCLGLTLYQEGHRTPHILVTTESV